MRALFSRSTFLLLTTILCCHCALATAAGDAPRNQVTSGPAISLTGKERLGRKWTDEQRIDNCNVPVDKRGNTPRPSTCYPALPDRPS
jgi:hypothetical protein